MPNRFLTRRTEESKSTKQFSDLSREVVDIAYKIHQTMGTGLLECIYEDCFVLELEKRNIPFERQKRVQVYYEGSLIKSTFNLDLVINNEIVVELKSVEKIINSHTAQILTYMRVSGYKTGLLINFGDPYFKAAIKRFVL